MVTEKEWEEIMEKDSKIIILKCMTLLELANIGLKISLEKGINNPAELKELFIGLVRTFSKNLVLEGDDLAVTAENRTNEKM